MRKLSAKVTKHNIQKSITTPLLRSEVKRLKTHRNRHRTGNTNFLRHTTPKAHNTRNENKRIVLPQRLDMEEHYVETVNHLKLVRKASNDEFRLGELNFDSINYISPSAALLLASEVDRWNQSLSKKLHASHEKWNTDIKRLLCEMGFFELLHIDRPDDLKNAENTRFLPFITGNIDNKNEDGIHAKNLRQKIEEVACTEISGHLLFTGLSEAITNVSHHAYKSNHDTKKSRWWMSAAFDKKLNLITVSFYDHGRTIPATLPSSKVFEKIKDFFHTWSDGAKIKAAMEYGRSSTGESSRGKGLQDFLEIIKEYPDSELRIYSRKGLLHVKNATAAPNNQLKFSYDNLKIALRGTLIEWRFSPSKLISQNES